MTRVPASITDNVAQWTRANAEHLSGSTDFLAADWARQWPAEGIWVARLGE